MHVTHETDRAAPAKTPEQLAGDEIRRLRKAQHWSQEELARRMAVYGYDWHQTTVGRTESGERPLRLNEVVHLAALFRVPVTQFLLPVDLTLKQIDKEITWQAKAREEIRERAETYRGTLVSYDAQADEFRKKYKELADELEQATSQLEILRGLREILARGQGAEAAG